MYHEGSCVQQARRAGFIKNIAVVVNQEEVGGLDEREMQTLEGES